MNFLCPNCNSSKYIGKHSIGKNFKNGMYQNVFFEIQCSSCFMDIPSILSENISNDKIQEVKNLWNDKYKPEHIENAPKCSTCSKKYWEIEKFLSDKNILSKDIFYQTYNPSKGVGDLVCRICDPSAFK